MARSDREGYGNGQNKSETDRLRNAERNVETDAAYAGGGEASESEGSESTWHLPEEKWVDDVAAANEAVSDAKESGASGPGQMGGESTELY